MYHCLFKMFFVVFSLTILALHTDGYTNVYIGCYKNIRSSSALPYNYAFIGNATVDWCIDRCALNGYRYAGLQAHYECRCGNANYNKYGSSTECDRQCGGNRSEICGGRYGNSVYEILYTITASTTTAATAEAATTSILTTTASINQHADAGESERDDNVYIYIGVGVAAFLICVAVAVAAVLLHKRRVASALQQREDNPNNELSDDSSTLGNANQASVHKLTNQNEGNDGGTYENCGFNLLSNEREHKHVLSGEVIEDSVENVEFVDNDLYGS